MRLSDAGDIAAWRLCLGCGACAWACPEKAVRLVDVTDDGIRPVVDGQCDGCSRCVDVCPGAEISAGAPAAGADAALLPSWGPVLGIWEGWATDPEIRFKGSSGGAATALALYCVEREGMHGAVHAGADPADPLRNRTTLSTGRAGLLSNAGSRYSPASPCASLGLMESAPSPCVFIGKPCDVAGLRKAQKLSPALSERTGLAISIFCAGTPSTRGTLELIEKSGLDPAAVRSMRYRGNGWPGDWSARSAGGEASMPYRDAWSFLQRYRPLRCHLCPDGTGQLADISCGDPWYRQTGPGESGLSLLVARTPEGASVLERAEKSGYLALRRLSPEHLERSQENLLRKRQAVWGRLLAMALMLAPRPRFSGFRLYSNWRALNATDRLRSVVGTIKRGIRRGYYRKTGSGSGHAADADISTT